MAKEAVNRWIGIIFSGHSWIGKQFPRGGQSVEQAV